jgi:hypothetical protein
MTEYGYLIVNTRTARGAVPVEAVKITVTDWNGAESNVVSAIKTDRNGSTLKIRLPASPRKNTESPNNGNPCALYNIDADCEGYYPVRNIGAQIYSGVTSVLPVELIPLADGIDPASSFIDIMSFDGSELPDL